MKLDHSIGARLDTAEMSLDHSMGNIKLNDSESVGQNKNLIALCKNPDMLRKRHLGRLRRRPGA